MGKDKKPGVGDIQVDASQYFTQSYCQPGRFASYANQINEALGCGAKSVLEIGPGNGVVTYLLKRSGIDVDTLDHDPDLNPDYVGSVLKLPFESKSYDLVMCCQVLEHLPWNTFLLGLQEITRVSRNTVILSLPHRSRDYFIKLLLPKIGLINWSKSIPLRDSSLMEFDGEHYWELGRGIDIDDIEEIVNEVGWCIYKSFRVTELLYHHFFILRPSPNSEG